MLLRVKPEHAVQAVERFPGFDGQLLDAAEILEAPGVLMVRLPGTPRWPIPGAAGFGWRPDIFETPGGRIEIASCGYSYSSYLAWDAFGVVYTDSAVIQRLKEVDALLHHINPPERDVLFSNWRLQFDETLPDSTVELLYALDSRPLGLPEIVIHESVIFPPELAPSLVAVYYVFRVIALQNASLAEAKKCIAEFVTAFLGHCGEPQVLNHVFWHGDGDPLHTIQDWCGERNGRVSLDGTRDHP